MILLLSSRLYCRFRILTGISRLCGSRTCLHLSWNNCSVTAGRELHPTLKNFTFIHLKADFHVILKTAFCYFFIIAGFRQKSTGIVRLSAYISPHTFLHTLICPRTGADRKALQQYSVLSHYVFLFLRGCKFQSIR